MEQVCGLAKALFHFLQILYSISVCGLSTAHSKRFYYKISSIDKE